MEVSIKKLHPDAVIPFYAHNTDAGMDLTATSFEYDAIKKIATYGTGLAIAIPEGHVGLIFPRSSVYKTSLVMANSVGVIDSGYRGEIMVKFRDVSKEDFAYNILDRVAQLMIVPYPKISFKEVDDLEVSDRNEGGFGSTGN